MQSKSKIVYRIALTVFSLLFLTGYKFAPQTDPNDENVTIRITQADTSQFPQVTLYISAVDEEGEPVGVDPARLVIMENGVIITPDHVQGVGEIGSLTTMLVMDVSGSMNFAQKLESAKSAAQTYISQMRSSDQAGLLTFNTQIEYVQPITTNHQELSSAIDSLKAHDDTAMYDALVNAIEILESVSGRKAIIVLTDGLDNRSTHTQDDVIQTIGPEGVSISSIGLGEPSHSRAALSALDEPILVSLAENAGGTYAYANDEATLRSIYERYGRVLQSEYVITYTSPSALRDGVNRALSASLSDSPESAPDQVIYNPGGLVPETSELAPWPLFFTLLAGLAALLVFPSLINGLVRIFQGSGKVKGKPAKKGSRIKFKD